MLLLGDRAGAVDGHGRVVDPGGVGVDLVGVLVLVADSGAEVEHAADRVELHRAR